MSVGDSKEKLHQYSIGISRREERTIKINPTFPIPDASADHFVAHIVKNIHDYLIEEFSEIPTPNINKYGILKRLHKAHFLFQLARERDQFRASEEYRNGNAAQLANGIIMEED